MNSLLIQLKDIQTHLEDEYLGIGDNFKKLISEMEHSLSRSRSIVEDFRSRISSGDSESLSGRIEEIQGLVEKETVNHNGLVDDSRELMSRLVGIYQRLGTLQEPISEIQDSAELMSLLAINSMVVAIQAGSEGGGFTTITDELKTASADTHSYASEIEKMGRRVASGFGRFDALAAEIEQKETQVAEFLHDELPGAFGKFRNSIGMFIEQLVRLGDAAESLEPRMMEIMQSLQNQDIIRQSMDHVILSLVELDVGEFRDEAGDAGYLELKRQLYSLSRTVIQDVLSWLQTDLDNLQSGTREFKKILQDINREKDIIYDSAKAGACLFCHISAELTSFKEKIEQILYNTEQNRKMRKELFEENRSLLTALNDLRPQIQGLSELVDLFGNINVMARIEIARSDVFGNIQESVRKMVSINRRIEKSVSVIIEVEELVHESSDENQKTFDLILQKDQGFVETFREDIRALIAHTETSMGILRNILDGFNPLSDDFLDIFTNIEGRTGKIEKSYREILELDELFEKEILFIESEEEKRESGSMDLEEIQRRVEKILEKFTIFRHKKEAGNLSGLEITEESFLKESSIVLF